VYLNKSKKLIYLFKVKENGACLMNIYIGQGRSLNALGRRVGGGDPITHPHSPPPEALLI
jgi:hypothetical protein